MTLLITGLIIWYVAHLIKRVTPEFRQSLSEKMGNASKGVFALLIVLSVVLMVLGYRRANFIPVWFPPEFMVHLNNLLMLTALYVYGAGGPKGAKVWLGTKIRHPQLVGFSIWAVAHLLVNGDLASLMLFGALLVWAQLSIFMINAADGPWVRPDRAPAKKEIVLVGITLVLFCIIAGVHIWLGRWPFPGGPA